jgi:transitional endoplasmic reticulum ATPase
MSREHDSIIARMLEFFVDNRALGSIFVAATNHIDAIDPAIRRPGRFDFVFEVPNPDLAAREGLLRVGIKKTGLSVTVPDAVIKSLARRWNGFNTSTILAIPAEIPQFVKDTGKTTLVFDDFMAMHRRQQGIANKVAESTKSFADMSFVPEQAAAIKNLISRMDRSFEIEESGGDAPSGALFYGEPGTGKTESARMIAKETKWAFFPLTGPDIVRDPDIIEKTLKKVRNARPAIIFIDEADDLLGDRATSPYKAATNKLLAAMDGAGGRLSDLLWIASTNFPEASDAAVVRSGRFTEKIKFFKPGDEALLKFAKEFLTDQKRNAVMAVTWEELAEVLHGYSIADANGILMQAWNLTLMADGKVDRTNPFTLETVLKAQQMITL